MRPAGRRGHRTTPGILLRAVLTTLAAVGVSASPGWGQTYQTLSVVQDATIHRVENAPILEDDGFVQRFAGQVVERTVDLPTAARPLDVRRITARLHITPITSVKDGRRRPNDPWNRLGSVAILVPPADGEGPPVEVELMRIVTGYGGAGVFEQDITPLAPLLRGSRTFRVFVSSYSELPAWSVSLDLVYSDVGVGYRRPAFAASLFNDHHVTAEVGRRSDRLAAEIVIPDGLSLPRLRILSTGHASDGSGANEFVTSTHLLWIDGRIVARWRPWAERGGELRARNPWAGRRPIEGREIWSSDFDRSGWHPGEIVEPMVIPVPELTPGPHRIELEIRDIRPAASEEEPAHGFWVVSAVVVADEPWEE